MIVTYRIECDGDVTPCWNASHGTSTDLDELIKRLRDIGWFIEEVGPELIAWCPQHRDRAVFPRRPKTAEVRALSNASTDLLIARCKELIPDEGDNTLVNLTCTLAPEARRRGLIAMILEAELLRSELEELWHSVCAPDLTPRGPSHGKSLMVLQILDAELGPAPERRPAQDDT